MIYAILVKFIKYVLKNFKSIIIYGIHKIKSNKWVHGDTTKCYFWIWFWILNIFKILINIIINSFKHLNNKYKVSTLKFNF